MTHIHKFRPTIPPQKYFEYYNQEQNDVDKKNDFSASKDNKTKNVLIGSLMALAAMSIPAIEIIDDKKPEQQYYTTTAFTPQTEQITCNPEALAKGGKDYSTVELEELMNLINFSSLEGIPKSEQNTIKNIAMANLTPVNVNLSNAKERIIKQIQNVQDWVDKSAKEYKTNPPKSEYEKKLEYKSRYITGQDVAEQVDFSEIIKYQKDISLLKALIYGSTPKIDRRDYDSNEKFNQAIQNAQRTVDNITEKYKRHAKIAGNINLDNSLNHDEIMGLLDLSSLNGLPRNIQREIYNQAKSKCKTLYFGDVKNNQDIKEANNRTLKTVQKIQNILDSLAAEQVSSQIKDNI